MGDSKWVTITVPREPLSWHSPNFITYVNLLKNSVFPAIDELVKNGLVENYHILSHIDKNGLDLEKKGPGGLDIRILIANVDTKYDIEKVLKKYNLPTKMKDYAGDTKDTLGVLKLIAEIVRITIDREPSKIKDFFRQQQHYQNNAIGMNAMDERIG